MPKRKSKRKITTLGVSEFKSRCLALVDDLHRNGGEIVLIKGGKRVAKVVPFVDPRTPPLRGLFKGRLRILGDIAEVTFADL